MKSLVGAKIYRRFWSEARKRARSKFRTFRGTIVKLWPKKNPAMANIVYVDGDEEDIPLRHVPVYLDKIRGNRRIYHYNVRKQQQNIDLLWWHSIWVSPMSNDVCAFVFDDFLKGDLGEIRECPNTTDYLLQADVPPHQISVVNPDERVIQAVQEAGANGLQQTFNELVIDDGYVPDTPITLLYLDACGTYQKQLAPGLRAIIRRHKAWLGDTVVLGISVSTRNFGEDIDGVAAELREMIEDHYRYGSVALLHKHRHGVMEYGFWVLRRNLVKQKQQ